MGMLAQRMAKPTSDAIAASLTVSERVLLFCIASNTDWVRADISGATVKVMLVKNLIQRDPATARLVITEQGRAVLSTLLADE
jgi:hypothetical protein